MKKIISILSSVIFTLVLFLPISQSLDASAAEYTQNGLTLSYSVSGTDAIITDCTGSGSSLIIPDKINGYNVVSIEQNAFAETAGLTSLVIPNGIKSIKERAFWNCSSLKTVSIGSGVTFIGDYAFSACPQLSAFVVSNENTVYNTIGGMLCDKNITTIICYAGWSNSPVIPQGITKIAKAAFFGSSQIVSVEIPSSVVTIEDYAFSGCFSLSSVTIPISVTTIGKGCFMNCTALKSATLGNGISAIPDECFSMCTSLESVNITSSISSIGVQAFFSCSKLSGIYIPPTVTMLNSDAAGTKYDIRNAITPISGFYISGNKGSAADVYASSAGIDFIDFTSIPYGDVDGNNMINAVDASIVLTEYAAVSTGKPSSFTYYRTLTGDYNSDGIINAIDASKILSVYADSATGN